MKLIIKRNVIAIRNYFNVINEEKKILFKIVGSYIPFRRKMWILDSSKAKVAYIKMPFFSFRKYRIYVNDELVALVIKNKRIIGSQIDILSDEAYYLLKGYIADREFEIHRNKELIATVSNKYNQLTGMFGIKFGEIDQNNTKLILEVLGIIIVTYMAYD